MQGDRGVTRGSVGSVALLTGPAQGQVHPLMRSGASGRRLSRSIEDSPRDRCDSLGAEFIAVKVWIHGSQRRACHFLLDCSFVLVSLLPRSLAVLAGEAVPALPRPLPAHGPPEIRGTREGENGEGGGIGCGMFPIR